MMKERIRKFFGQCLDTLRLSPSESLLCLLFFVYCALLVEEVGAVKEREAYMALFPLFFSASLLLNRWLPRGAARWGYWLSPLLAIPFLWVDAEGWVNSIAYRMALVLCVLAVLICRWRRENVDFVGDGLHYLKNIAFAGLLSGVTWGLFMAIYYSLRYIFPALPLGEENDVTAYSAMVAFILLLPLLFLTLVRLQPDRFRSVKIVDMVMNYVLSPALLIYTAILYAYFLKITFTWSLPRGGIAWMVFAFTLIAVLAKAYQPMLERRVYDWFYGRFQWISLPALAMFWIGVAHRIGEYGLTQERVYLLVCGAIMTLVALMFFSARRGRYLYATAVAIAPLAAFTYIPGITARDLGVSSQRARLAAALAQLDLLDDAGRMKQEKQPDADSLRGAGFRQFYESFDYLCDEDDTVFLQELCGMTSAIDLVNRVLPDNVPYGYHRNRVEAGDADSYHLSADHSALDVSGFTRLYPITYAADGYHCRNDSDSLWIYAPADSLLLAESLDNILAEQLRRMELAPDSLLRTRLERRRTEFLQFSRGDHRVVFSSATLRRDSLRWSLTNVTAKYLLSRE